MREHLESFLATVREQRGKDIPHYVEEELRRYLRCGLACHGFLRVVCPACRKEILVAYSCKCRGTCPSCSARRMCGTAAHLVDHVLPDVPVRQFYLEDVLACPCGGRRRVVADIGQRAQREAIVALLTHLGIPTEPPPIARARG